MATSKEAIEKHIKFFLRRLYFPPDCELIAPAPTPAKAIGTAKQDGQKSSLISLSLYLDIFLLTTIFFSCLINE